MSESKLRTLSMDFAVEIIELVKQFKSLSDKCATIRVMLVASCRTAKENMK